MYIWSWTFLILPVAAILAGVGAFFAIKAIARKVKRKAAAQKVAKMSQDKEKQQEKQQEKTVEQTAEQGIVTTQTAEPITEQQPTPVAKTQKQTTDITAPESDAEYLREMWTKVQPFDAKDFDVVMKEQQKYAEIVQATLAVHNTASSKEAIEQAQQKLNELGQYFEGKYGPGSTPKVPRDANYSAFVLDKNGKRVHDIRNYCYDGNEAPNFKAACEKSYTPKGGDDIPTIFQVDSDGHPTFVVSSTQGPIFEAGIEDIKTTMQAKKIGNCTFRLVTYNDDRRELFTKEGTIKDIDAFLESAGIKAPTQENDFAK